MTSRVYAYLGAPATQQDVTCTKGQSDELAIASGIAIPSYFTENESDASLRRPELFRLLEIVQKGDVLLAEQVGRLSHLSGEGQNKLRSLINEKGVRAVALDLSTSCQPIRPGDEFTSRMLEALNGMMLDMFAAIARKGYIDRERRQVQGIVKAKSDDECEGRPEDTQCNERATRLLQVGTPYSDVMETVACSRAAVAKAGKSLKELV